MKKNEPKKEIPTLKDLAIKEKLLYKEVKNFAREDIETMANRISVEVAFTLTERFESIDVTQYKVRRGIHLMAIRLIDALIKTQDRCTVIPNGIPGFTVVGFKRKNVKWMTKDQIDFHEMENNEGVAAAIMINEYLKENEEEQHIVVIESPDLLMILFSVNESEGNLKKLGLL